MKSGDMVYKTNVLKFLNVLMHPAMPHVKAEIQVDMNVIA